MMDRGDFIMERDHPGRPVRHPAEPIVQKGLGNSDKSRACGMPKPTTGTVALHPKRKSSFVALRRMGPGMAGSSRFPSEDRKESRPTVFSSSHEL